MSGGVQGPPAGSGYAGLLPGWALAGMGALVTAGLVVAGYQPLGDPDTGWHVAAGRYLARTGSFAGPDAFGVMTHGPWVLHEWLPELLMAAAAALGDPALRWLQALGMAGVVLAFWVTARARSSALLALAATLVGTVAASGSLTLRPQLVTFAFAAVTTGAWLSSAADRCPRWWLVPLTWLWACCHGMWAVGPGIGVVAVAGVLLDQLAARHTLRGAPWRLLAIPVLSVLAACLTPLGPAILLTPSQVVTASVGFVSEWDPATLTSAPALGLGVLAAAACLGLAVTAVRRGAGPGASGRVGGPLVPPSTLAPSTLAPITMPPISSAPISAAPITLALLTVAGVLVALPYARTVAVGAAILTPVAAAALQPACAAVLGPARGRPRVETAGVLAGLGAALLICLAHAPLVAPVTARSPDGLDGALDALPAGTVVCNDYGWGGWLIGAHPSLRPAIDGRIELYDPGYLQDYRTFAAARPGWERYPARNGCTVALLTPDASARTVLQQVAGWRVLASDETAVLLVRP